MFKAQTLFVLGAGASVEAGFPLGSNLAESLSRDLYFCFEGGRLTKGDPHMYSELEKVARAGTLSRDELFQAARQVSAGVQDAESIDNFVDLHTDKTAIQAIAKIGIAVSIARAERQSQLFSFDKNKGEWQVRNSVAAGMQVPRQTWYQKFFEVATSGVRASDLDHIFDDVRVVCFNYDRSLEQFLLLKIMSLYSVDATTAAQAVRRLRIIRPYGGLGALPLLGDKQGLEYGQFDHHRDYWKIAENIRTYSELPGSDVLLGLTETTAWAKQIVFLGFGFHRQNLRLLVRDHSSQIFVYATTYKMSEPNKSAIRARLHETFRDAFHLHTPNDRKSGTPVLSDLGCGDFMSDFKEVLRA